MLHVSDEEVRGEWFPPELDEEDVLESVKRQVPEDQREGIWFVICQFEPYLDTYLVSFQKKDGEIDGLRRFVFREGHVWAKDQERIFREFCLNDPTCQYRHEWMDAIFSIWEKKCPGFHLRRYYTQDFRMLDHLYHCCKQNTPQEILYKAGLDELAVDVEELDEIDLLAGSPSAIYGGVPMKVLRAMNSREGARFLETAAGRNYVRELQKFFPQIFSHRLNDAQCKYLHKLYEEQLTAGEAGRLYLVRKGRLQTMWNDAQYELMGLLEQGRAEVARISAIDPIYQEYFSRNNGVQQWHIALGDLKLYLLQKREEYDGAIRRSNRKREYDWQERKNGYVVRYPQTINDICREAIYMSNCLMGYVEAYVANDTTILFMRRPENFNKPFITIEIFDNRLMQAYHRFNADCNEEEAQWIREYCDRHGIDCSRYQFNRNLDRLF